MTYGWAGMALLGDAATAGSGTANAAYFARRASGARGPRAAAAGVLTLLFAGCAVDAAVALHTGGAGGAAFAVRAPVLAANLATSVLLVLGARR